MNSILDVISACADDPSLSWTGVCSDPFQVIDAVALAHEICGGYVDCCTFSIGWEVAQHLARMGARRVMVSREVLTLHRFDGARILGILGPAYRMGVTHAKFAVCGRMSVLTSANLNKNHRAEWYHVTSNPGVRGMLLDHLDELERIGDLPNRPWSYYNDSYHTAMGGVLTHEIGSLRELIARFTE